MKTNAELDKWAAEKCGVEVFSAGINADTLLIDSTKYPQDVWTLSDARCREIVRECFNITTGLSSKRLWRAGVPTTGKGMISKIGKSIEAAEIACIQAIKDAEGA